MKRPSYDSVDEQGFTYSGYTAMYKESELRKKAFGWHGKTCAKCRKEFSSQKQLVIHHRHYRSLGKEHPDDVVVLCRPCHDSLHKRHVAKKLTAADIPLVDPRWECWLRYED